MLLRDIFSRLIADKYEDITKLSIFLTNQLTTDRFSEILEVINAQQQALLAERKVYELNDDELVAYSELGNIRQEIEAAKLKRSMDADFMSWLLYEDGLATLKRIATTLVVL